MKLKNFFDFKKIMRKTYYYVPPCPCCNSAMTGRYVNEHRKTELDWMMKESLKNGEIICPVPEIGENNAFCLECGFAWNADIELQFITISEINDERIARMTDKLYQSTFEPSEEKEKQNEKKRGFVARHVGKFVGKI